MATPQTLMPQVLLPQTPPTPQMPTPPVLTPPVLTPPVLTPLMPTLADVDTSQDAGSGGGTTDIPLALDKPDNVWPKDTDLIFTPGTNKVMLTLQLPLMRAVMQDAFERVRFFLLFSNAFPDAIAVLDAVKTALTSASSGSTNPRAWIIHDRLLSDEEYASKMIRLVSCCIIAFPFP
jgi:hypothetical protein